jgi:hypothetical protein
MQTTLSGNVPAYVGADLTDRYSDRCRAVDVCGLTPEGNSLRASFWNWIWDRPPQPLNVEALVKELRAARVAMLDGPQALAVKGATLRVCERESAAVGKTPDTRPALSRPFAGFICSSLELFAGLKFDGIAISPPAFAGGVSEVYPGHIWTLLNGGRPLPQKSTEAGRLARRAVLEALGVTDLPALPTHDQNDAAVAAILAAASDSQVTGVTAALIGEPLTVDSDGTLREGPMVIPRVSGFVVGRIADALREVHIAKPSVGRVIQPAPEALHVAAEELLAHFIAQAINGDPQVCTYGWAYRTLFDASYTKFSMAYAPKAIEMARRTGPSELPGLGLVRLDTFIVSKRDGLPGDGYWPAAHHDLEEWERVLGNATIID